MPLLGNDKIEDCPICYNAFSNEDIVYRPLLDGLVGKPYHKKCLEEWCDKSGEPCVDPVTTIKFNISSKIKCNYSQPYQITVHAEDERILLGTEPCDRFDDIKKFMSSRYKIPMKSITLWKIEGMERTPAVDSEFIGENLDLQLMTITPRADPVRANTLTSNDKIEKIAKEIEKIELLERTEDLSSDQITDAAKQSVDVVDVEEVEEVEDEDELDLKIQAAIQELERMLALHHNDQLQDELQTNKEVLTGLLFSRIPALYEQVKDSLVPFLSGTRDFSKSTLRALEKFVGFIVLLLKMGVSALTLIAKLGWPIVKLIPSILYYIGYYGVYTPISGLYNLYNKVDEDDGYFSQPARDASSSSWSGSSGGDAASSGDSSWWGSSGNADSSSKGGWFGSSSSGGASSSSSSKGGWFGSPDPAPRAAVSQIRQRDAPNVRDARERGEDVSSSVYDGLRKGDVFRKGFFFRNKHSKRMRRMRRHRKMRK